MCHVLSKGWLRLIHFGWLKHTRASQDKHTTKAPVQTNTYTFPVAETSSTRIQIHIHTYFYMTIVYAHICTIKWGYWKWGGWFFMHAHRDTHLCIYVSVDVSSWWSDKCLMVSIFTLGYRKNLTITKSLVSRITWLCGFSFLQRPITSF